MIIPALHHSSWGGRQFIQQILEAMWPEFSIIAHVTSLPMLCKMNTEFHVRSIYVVCIHYEE